MEHFSEFFSNNILWFIALGVIIAMLIIPLINGVQNLDPLQSVQKMNSEGSLILDIREQHEFEKGHILNAKHIPLGKLSQQLKELEKYREKSIIVVCQSGNRSSHACRTLKKSGFNNTFNLRGGMLAWGNDNLPISNN